MLDSHIVGSSILGERIARARREAGLTQAQLAGKVSVGRTAISKTESGRRRVESTELARFARALGRPVDWFLDPGPDRAPTLGSLRRKRRQIARLAARHGARGVRVFGSVARGEADAGSDVDLLVDLEPGRSLFDRAALVVDLQDLLGTTVDVVSEAGIPAEAVERILADAVRL